MDQDYGKIYSTLYKKHWWWRTREAIVLKEIKSLQLPAQPRILDFGCGDGLLLPKLLQVGDAVGIETDTHLISPDNPVRERIKSEPIESKIYDSMKFDLIVALDVLEHIEKDDLALSRLFSLLAPGGKILLTVPAMMRLWDEHDVINKHWRRYSKDQLQCLILKEGQILKLRFFYHWIGFLKLMVAFVNKVSNSKVAQHKIPNGAVNRLMHAYCKLEYFAFSKLNLPFGSSLLAIAEKR